jgi:zinc-binding in reverse transcriptase
MCSPFWKDVVSVKHFLTIGSSRLIGLGDSIDFWHDTWFENCPLTLYYPLVYVKVKNDRLTLSQIYNHGNIKLFLTKGVSSAKRIEKNKLLTICQSLHLSQQADSALWHLDNSSLYTVHSLYRFLNLGGVTCSLTRSVWSLKIPLKIKFFLWLSLHNQILTRDNLLRKGWVGSAQCPFCPLSSQLWHLICHFFPQGNLLPTTSLQVFWHTCLKLSFKDMNFWGIILAVVLWTLWTARIISFLELMAIIQLTLYISLFVIFSYWTGSSFSIPADSSHGALNGTRSSAQGRGNGSIVQLDATGNFIGTNTMVQLGRTGTSTISASTHITEQLSDKDLLE